MADSRFSSDAYISKRCVRSVLCAPLSLKARFYGVIYIENHNLAGMFGPDRLRLLQVLAGQLVNSLENARLADELRRANSNMKRKNNKLQAIDQAKDDFLAVASHELRTPLTGIIGMAGLMADTKMTPHQEELLQDVDAESETLLQLVNDVLDLSKLKAKKVVLVRALNCTLCVVWCVVSERVFCVGVCVCVCVCARARIAAPC
jgi:signal transduction histidine kinase